MNLKYLFLLLSIVSVAIGLGAMFMGHSTSSNLAMVEGIAKGLGGVFFILFYIFMLLGKQPTDKTTH
ncbi:MAG TPA: hypothetical protein VK633_04790 [Verrucomicrobiae bacterium]|nr:hypothetical protein [Verrucomicrobiae bacterium]